MSLMTMVLEFWYLLKVELEKNYLENVWTNHFLVAYIIIICVVDCIPHTSRTVLCHFFDMLEFNMC